MRESVKDYVELFEKTLNLSGISWWIIDFKENPDSYYCNALMEETFSLDKKLPFHSIEETCPIAGDYNQNIELACETNEHARVVINEYRELLSGKTDEYDNQFPYYDKTENKTLYFSSRAKVLERNAKNEVSILYGMIVDITSQETQKKELQEYADIIDKNVLTSSIDVDGNFVDISNAYSELIGYSEEEIIGKHNTLLKHPDTPIDVYSEIWKSISSGEIWEGELLSIKKDGSEFWIYVVISPRYDDLERIKGYTSIIENITDKKIIEELSKRDKLTNLYNRVKIDETLEYEYKTSQRYGKDLSLIILDIDYFKSVNDTHGHLVGDSVLVELASILETNLRESDIVGRWGGEEFVIICSNSDKETARLLSEKLRAKIEDFKFNTVKDVTASFGIAELVKGDTTNSLISRADKALYKAKELGRNRVETL